MATSLKVAVIGAGLAGLTAARELQREAHHVIVFEKSHRLGGLWLYDPRVESDLLGLDPNGEIIHGSLYKSLRTNLPRQLMSFSDYKFTERQYGDPRTFPGHEEVLKFLEGYANEFGLTKLIRFNTEVTRVELVDSAVTEFLVESKTSDGVSSEEVFDAVVVCNGHHTQPRVATDIPGITTWRRKQIHSHNYRVPEPFENQIVVLIGSGPSAIDISREIATVAKEVHMSSRSPNVKVSKLDECNNLWQHSKIDCVYKDGTVIFQDGHSIEADIIIHCTGYNISFPFLRTNGLISVDEKRVGPLYKHVFPPQLAPRLSFVGLTEKFPVFLITELQSRWIAQALSGKVSLPSEKEMLDDVNQYYREMEEKGVRKYHTHSLDFKMDYFNWLAVQSGTVIVKEIKDTIRLLYECIMTHRDGFRDALKAFFPEQNYMVIGQAKI